MREILFRGKRIDNGEWVEGGVCKYTRASQTRDTRESYIVSMCNGLFKEVVPETVGEYTGLTDKTGKKIFEGDIVTYVGEVCLVKWNNDTAKFVLENENLACDFEDVWCKRFKLKIEVIGNMHDNPELLEEEEE